MLHFPGVPWKVPGVDHFDIKQLPSMLQKAGFREPFVWIDFFCIPQDIHDPEQAKICQNELVRQAKIFRNAQSAVVWLNEVPNWNFTKSAIDWLAYEFFRCTAEENLPDLPLVGMFLELSKRLCTKPCSLLRPHEEEPEKKPVHWFSSLWTLQEVCIRPDMVLLDREWRPLVIGKDLPMTIDTLFNLFMLRYNLRGVSGESMQRKITELDAALPPGPRELYQLISITGLNQIADLDLLSPLILGGRRVCTKSRAQAIMAVTGGTDWFRQMDISQAWLPENADEIIFGLYPPEFIDEIRKMTGGAFFLCRNESSTMTTKDSEHERVQIFNVVQGTMLPFSPGSSGRFPLPLNQLHGFVDHPSVPEWQIKVGSDRFFRTPGMVHIPAAGIMASNNPSRRGPLNDYKVNFTGNDPDHVQNERSIRAHQVVLGEWLSRYVGECYALCVMHSKKSMHGILLHRGTEHVGPFVKAGTFELEISEGLPEISVTAVDWNVL